MGTQKKRGLSPFPHKPYHGIAHPVCPHPHLRRIVALIMALYLALNIGGKYRIATREYEVTDARIHDSIRICVVSDLHNASYGNSQTDLLSAIDNASPDVVLLLGDLFDQYGENRSTITLLNALSDRYSCYYILGNHEYKTGRITTIRAIIHQAGIPILAGDSALIAKGETKIRIFGIDDGRGGKRKQLYQIREAAKQRNPSELSILAIHVPNDVESYLGYKFDLMLSGHTHGGQIILPGLFNGLYAPGQGFFPKYGGGCYQLGETTLIISRGLSRKPIWLPRIFNPPELTVVTLTPIGVN